MYKKLFSLCLCVGLLLLMQVVPANAQGVPTDLSAQACVLMVANTKQVLFARNENDKLPMASTTKIMTALLALERGIPEQVIKVSSDMVAVEGTSIGLLPDDLISVRTLVSGMLLESGNDAANVTAYAVAGGQKAFLELMNQKAREIGMRNTCFESVSGLDSENHYSTAYDMALLSAYAIQNVEFRRVCALPSERVSYGNPPYARTLRNHNKMLQSYEGAFGIKTGFTKKSGRCLVTAAERNGVTLVAVTLHAPNDWADHKKLLDYGFSVTQMQDCSALTGELTIPVVGGDASVVGAALQTKPFCPVTNESAPITAEVFLQPFLYAPVALQQSVGFVRYQANGVTVLEVPLLAANAVQCVTQERSQEPERTFFEKVKSWFQK